MYYNVFGEKVSRRRFKEMCDARKNRREPRVYEHTSSFTRAFQRRFLQTPRDYRNGV